MASTKAQSESRARGDQTPIKHRRVALSDASSTGDAAGWANFQVMRRTHASLGHEVGIDPKVAADQRGHGIGVALDVYTKASIGRRAEAGAKLENAVFAS